MIITTCSVCVKTIMAESSTFDQSVIRRLIFAAKQIPEETPRYWDMVSSFGFNSTSVGSSVSDVRVMIENLEFMDHKTFLSDRELFKELCMKEGFEKNHLGVVLISSNNTCKTCGGNLLVRKDRPSFLTLYTNDFGTLPATHFRKYCHNARKGCSFTQHYGFSSSSTSTEYIYDTNWLELPYFVFKWQNSISDGFSQAVQC